MKRLRVWIKNCIFHDRFSLNLPQNEPEVNSIVFLRAKGKAPFPKQLLTSLTTGCLTDVTDKWW